MKLLIVIPALNEEAGIESIIQRTLEARSVIMARSPVTAVDITVVSDGSTDRTVDIARRYSDRIRLIVFEKNRGYGAAIKEGWARSDAELLGFLDADGTCDPVFFADLCQALERDDSDVALGNRLHARSRMPALRRAGNFLFARMLTLFSAVKVRDTASGMRVVRRASLPKLLPLPDGLHFTPAMSARALLDDDLRISEEDMPYHERTGTSKLKVWRDGLRFLKTILESAFLYRPSAPLELVGFLALGLAVFLMAYPVIYYLQTRTVAEWMIYRFVVSSLLGTSAGLLFCAAHVSRRMVNLVLCSRRAVVPRDPLGRFLDSRIFWYIIIFLFSLGGLLVLPSFWELVLTGATYEHWSRFIVMSFFYSLAIILLGTKMIGYSLGLLAARLDYLTRRTSAGTEPCRQDPHV
jgi:glycosyltransferase involved in cell wall biosynthesis